MQCEKIKELLLTDYLDNELSPNRKGEVEKHLESCEACRTFAVQAQQNFIEPFKSLENVKAPQHLWEKVQGAIEEQENQSLVARAWEGLSDILFVRKSIFALSTVAACLLLLVVAVKLPAWQTEKAANAYLNEQFEYFVYANDQEGLNGESLWADEYFL